MNTSRLLPRARRTLPAILVLILSAVPAPAGTAVTMSAIGAGGSGNFTVGFEFTSSIPLTVTHLGKWNWNTTSATQAAIWSSPAQALLATTTVPVAGSSSPSMVENNGSGNVVYRPVAPVTLWPGTYVIGAQSFASQGNFAYDSTIAMAPGLTWVRGLADNTSALSFPNDIVRTTPTCYFGPNFKFARGSLLPVRAYAYDGAGEGALPSTSPAFPDSGGTELINGQFPSSTSFGDAQWVGFQDVAPDDGTAHPQVTFDLGEICNLTEAVLTCLHSTSQAGSSISVPESVLVSFSNDGTSFSSPRTLSGLFSSAAGDEIRSGYLDLSGSSGRFVRLDLRNDTQWTFLTEVSFTGTVPEPATMGLLGLAGTGLAGYLRRRSRAGR